MSGLLFDERIVAVQPSLVRLVGSVTAAAVVQQIHYHAQAGHTEADGWVVRTYEALGNELGLDERKVGRAVVKLEQAGILETCQPEGHIRRKWYRIRYDCEALSDSSKHRFRSLQQPKSALPTTENGSSSSTERKDVRPAGSANDKSNPTTASYASLLPTSCERGCWSGWLLDHDGNRHRCSCAGGDPPPDTTSTLTEGDSDGVRSQIAAAKLFLGATPDRKRFTG